MSFASGGAVLLTSLHRHKQLSSTGVADEKPLFSVIQASFGHRIRDQGVGGSNPLAPTDSKEF